MDRDTQDAAWREARERGYAPPIDGNLPKHKERGILADVLTIVAALAIGVIAAYAVVVALLFFFGWYIGLWGHVILTFIMVASMMNAFTQGRKNKD